MKLTLHVTLHFIKKKTQKNMLSYSFHGLSVWLCCTILNPMQESKYIQKIYEILSKCFKV